MTSWRPTIVGGTAGSRLSDAGDAELPKIPIRGYPTLAAVDATHFSGEIHYFEIFDAAASDAIDGYYGLGLYVDFPDYVVSVVHDVYWTARR